MNSYSRFFVLVLFGVWISLLQLPVDVRALARVSNTSTWTFPLSATVTLTATQTLTPSFTMTASASASNELTGTESLTSSIETFSLSASDEATSTMTLSKSTTETVFTFSDEVTLTGTAKSPSSEHTLTSTESQSITDTVSTSYSVTNSLTLSDTVTVAITESKTLTETKTPSVSFTDEASLTASLSPTSTLSIADSESVSDTYTLSSSISTLPTLTDSFTISTTETVTSSGSTTVSWTGSLSADKSSSETLSPTVTSTLTLSLSFTPSSTISTTISRAETLTPTFSKSVTLTLSPSSTVTLPLSLSPTVTMTQSMTRSTTESLSETPTETFSASILPTATVSPALSIPSSGSQTTTISASLSTSFTRPASPSYSQNTFSMTPSSSKTVSLSLSASNEVTASESVSPTTTESLLPTSTDSTSESLSFTSSASGTRPSSVTTSMSSTLLLTLSPTSTLSVSASGSDTTSPSFSHATFSPTHSPSKRSVTGSSSATKSSTPSGTLTVSRTHTALPSITVALSPTNTLAPTATNSFSGSVSGSKTKSGGSYTVTISRTGTKTATNTFSSTVTQTQTITLHRWTKSDAITPTEVTLTITRPTFTGTDSASPTLTISESLSRTGTVTETEVTPSGSVTSTFTKTFSQSDTEATLTVSMPSASTSGSSTNVPTVTPPRTLTWTYTQETVTGSPSSSASPEGTISESASSELTLTESLSPTETSTLTPSATESNTWSLSNEITATESQTKSGTFSEDLTLSTHVTGSALVTVTAPITPSFTQTFSTSVTATQTESTTGTISGLTNSHTESNEYTATKTDSLTVTSSESESPTWSNGRLSNERTASQSGSFSISFSDEPSLSESTTKSTSETLTRTGTETNSITETESVTHSDVVTPSPEISDTGTATDTITFALTYSGTETLTRSLTQSASLTGTESAVVTVSEEVTPTPRVTDTWEITRTVTPTRTPTKTQTFSETFTAEVSLSATRSGSPTQTSTFTLTRSNTETETASVTETATTTQTQTHTAPTLSRSSTLTATQTMSQTESKSQSPSSSVTLSVSPSMTTTFSASASGSLPVTVTTSPTQTPPTTISDSITRPSMSLTKTVTESGSWSRASHSGSSSVSITESVSISDPTKTPTQSHTKTDLRTGTITETFTLSWSNSKTHPSYTGSKDLTLTYSGTQSLTHIPTKTVTVTLSYSQPTPSQSVLPTATETLGHTDTITYTTSLSDSQVPTETVTQPTPSQTVPSPSFTRTFSPSSSFSNEVTLSPTVSLEVSLSVTNPVTLTVTDGTFTLTPSVSVSDTWPSISQFTKTQTPSHTVSLTVSDSLTVLATKTETPGTFTLTGTETLFATPTVTPPTPSATLLPTDTETMLPTDTATDSNTKVPSDTFTDQETFTLTPTVSPFTSSASATYIDTVSQTITPPATATKTLSGSESDSIFITVSGFTSSLSLSRSRGTLSLTDEDTESVSISKSKSHTFTTTESISPTVTLTETIQVFTSESDFLTSPKSSTDVLPVNRPATFTFIKSPKYAPGDKAGLVPTGEVCSTYDSVTEKEIPNSNMHSLQSRKPHIPSNWSTTVTNLGTYDVCAYQDVIGKWVKINPSRPVSFGATFFPALTSHIYPVKMPAGEIEITLPMNGADSGDIVRLIPFGYSCQSSAPSIFLLASSIWSEVVRVTGTSPNAGDYAMCYKGYPQWKSKTYFIYAPFRIYGIATHMNIHTPLPVMSNGWLNITVHGRGMALIDHWFLGRDKACTEVISRPILTTKTPSRGLTSVNMLVQATQSGVLVMCYRSNFTKYATPIVGNIEILPILAHTVIPANETYAKDTHVMLTFLGDLLSPEHDTAELHLGSHCGMDFYVPLTYNGSMWLGAVNTTGTYTVCYGTNASNSEPVWNAGTKGYYQVYVMPRFYTSVQEFWTGMNLDNNFTTEMRGWGLNPSTDSLWMQSATIGCHIQSSSALLPWEVSQRSVTWNATLVGYMQLCYTTNQNVTLSSQELIPVEPAFPSSFAPTQGQAQSAVLISFFGAKQLDLINGDKVGICVDATNHSIAQQLTASGPETFSFLPEKIGDFYICVESNIKIHDNQTVVSKMIGAYNALPTITSIVTSPSHAIAVIRNPITIELEGVGLSIKDQMYLCYQGTTTAVSANNTFQLKRDVVNKDLWTVTFEESVAYAVCYTFGSVTGVQPIRIVPSIIGEPALEILVPAIVYAGAPQYTSYSGLALQTLSSVFINIDNIPCNESKYKNNLTFPLNSTGETLFVEVPNRGTYDVCYTGLSGLVFTAFSKLRVVPRVITMNPINPSTIYGGCPMQVDVAGNGLLLTDGFYLSTHSSCLYNNGQLTPTANISKNVTFTNLRFDGLPALTDTQYYLCYAPVNDALQAVMRGTFKAYPPFSLTRDNTTGYRLQHRCAFVPGSKYRFQLQTQANSATTAWITLDDILSTPVLTIGHLPFRFFKVRMVATAPDGSTTISAMTTSLTGTVDYCLSLPAQVSVGVSATKQFAEALFILMNYLALECKSLGTTKSNPSAIVLIAQGLLNENPNLLTDPVTMLTPLKDSLPATNNPTNDAVGLLNVTVPNLVPYGPADPGVIEAHLGVVATAITILQGETGGNPETQLAALELALDRVHLAATVACAASQDYKLDYGVYATTVQKNLPQTDSGFILVGSNTRTTIVMTAPSTEGYCFSVTTMPVSILSRIRHRRRQSAQSIATHSDISAFNLPLFSIVADPLKTSGTTASIKTAEIEYNYPIEFGPASAPALVHNDVYTYARTSRLWTKEEGVATTADTSARLLNFNVSSPSSSGVLLSGKTTWTPIAAEKPAKVIDWVLVILTSMILIFYIAAMIGGRIRDTNVDSAQEPKLQKLQFEMLKPTMARHRWIVCFNRFPFHPISTMERLVMAFSYLCALLLFSIFVASRENEQPGNTAIGMVSGLVAAVLATPLATLIRIPLALQLKDKVSLCAALVALLLCIPIAIFSTFAIAAAASTAAGLLAAVVTAYIIRDSWSLRTMPRPGPMPTCIGVGLAGLCGLGAIFLGYYKGIADLLPQSNRDTYLVLSTFLWGAVLDGLLLEPLKHYVLPKVARKFNEEIDVEDNAQPAPENLFNEVHLPTKYDASKNIDPFGRYLDDYQDGDYEEVEDAVTQRTNTVSRSNPRVLNIEDDFEEVVVDSDGGLEEIESSRQPSEVDLDEFEDAVAPASPIQSRRPVPIQRHGNPFVHAFDPYSIEARKNQPISQRSPKELSADDDVSEVEIDDQQSGSEVDIVPFETSYEMPEPRPQGNGTHQARNKGLRIQDYYV